jgi:hypothetical protein
VTVTERTGGEKVIRSVDPILGKVFHGTVSTASGGAEAAELMLRKAFKKEDGDA